MGIGFSKWPPDRGWETALTVLGAIGGALRSASIEEASVFFTVKGADVDELRTKFVVALAREPGLGTVELLKDDGERVRGVSVDSADEGGLVAQITFARRGQPGRVFLKNMSAYVVQQDSGFVLRG